MTVADIFDLECTTPKNLTAAVNPHRARPPAIGADQQGGDSTEVRIVDKGLGTTCKTVGFNADVRIHESNELDISEDILKRLHSKKEKSRKEESSN